MVNGRYNEPTSLFCTKNRLIEVLKPETFEPRLEDIYRALPKINRFNGQTSEPYSVARHSMSCMAVLMKEHNISNKALLLMALFHDGAEAYLGDIVRPIKKDLAAELIEIEYKILVKIYDLVGVDKDVYTDKDAQQFISAIDTQLAATEADKLVSMKVLPEVTRLPSFYVMLHDRKREKMDSWRYDFKKFRSTAEILINAPVNTKIMEEK